MISRLICRLVVALVCLPSMCPAQESEESIAIHKALKISSLTFDGRPFHAVLQIGKAGEDYSGRVEIWWVDAAKYRLVVGSPNFNQTKVVD